MKEMIDEYNDLKKEYNNILHDETLKKYKILSKAYKIGNKIYGRRNFSVMRLSLDFDLPYSTTKRILSLDKANKRTWEMINSGKLSSFRAAMILMQKNSTFQDEIVDMVLNDNLTTYQIKSLKIRSLKDLQKERTRIAVERGYSRASSAYRHFSHVIGQIDNLLGLMPHDLPEKKIDELKKQLIDINKKIDKYVKTVLK